MRTNAAWPLLLTAGLLVLPRPLLAQDPPLSDWETPAEWPAAFRQGLPTNPLTFVGIVPCRLADTREATFPAGYGPPALAAGSPRNFVLTGRCGIPTTALAVSANVTAVNPAGLGFLLIRPADGPSVIVSTLNFIPNQTIANGAIIPLGTGGAATFLAGVTSTQVIIDVNGYYEEPAVGTGGDITGVTAGAGLTGGGLSGDVALAVDPATVQSRVTGSCPAGQSIRVVGQTGTVTCEVDDAGVTSVASGAGLTGGPITTTGTLSVNFGGTGASTAASRSDHDHFGQSWSGGGTGLVVSSSSGIGLRGVTAVANSYAVLGEATSPSGVATGVYGSTTSPDGRGVTGVGGASSGQSIGVYGNSASPTGYSGYFAGRVYVGGELVLNGALSTFATATIAATGDGVSNSTSLANKRFCALVRMNQVGTVNPGTNFSCAVTNTGTTFTLTARASSPSHTVTCDMACF